MSAAVGSQTDSLAVRPPYPAAVAISGPAWHSDLVHEGRVLLARSEVQIGRMGTNDVVLSDPVASRHHAVIRWSPNGYVLQDAGSTNGTYVQGQRITEPVLLVPGQHFHVGGTDFAFDALQAPREAAPPAPAPLVGIALPGAPAPSFASGSTAAAQAVPQQALAFPVPAPTGSRFQLWLKRQVSKTYWRVFLITLAAYIVATMVLNYTHNYNLVPMVLLIGSIVVPISFVRFCFEEGAFVDMPIRAVGLTFISGAVFALILAAVLEQYLVSGTTFGTWVIVGLCEESAKVAAVVWFLRNRNLRNELDGLVLGAAAGMGFAALETAGYGFFQFLAGFTDDYSSTAGALGARIAHAVGAGTDLMTHELVLRMSLALFGHGVWTAIIAAAIWRDRGNSIFRLTPGVILAFGISVTLHATWDWYTSVVSSTFAEYVGLILIGLVGLFILRFFIREGLQRASLGPMAPPPPPLPQALANYLAHPFGGPQRAAAVPQSQPLMNALASAVPVQAPAPGAPPAGAPWAQPTAPFGAEPIPVVACPRCSAPNPAGSRFCFHCGNPLPQSGPPRH